MPIQTPIGHSTSLSVTSLCTICTGRSCSEKILWMKQFVAWLKGHGRTQRSGGPLHSLGGGLNLAETTIVGRGILQLAEITRSERESLYSSPLRLSHAVTLCQHTQAVLPSTACCSLNASVASTKVPPIKHTIHSLAPPPYAQ